MSQHEVNGRYQTDVIKVRKQAESLQLNLDNKTEQKKLLQTDYDKLQEEYTHPAEVLNGAQCRGQKQDSPTRTGHRPCFTLPDLTDDRSDSRLRPFSVSLTERSRLMQTRSQRAGV